MVDHENENDPRTETGTGAETLGAEITGRDTTQEGRGEPGSQAPAGSVMDNSMPTDEAKDDFPEDEPAQ